MFTLLLLGILVAVIILAFYISTYLYENDITLVALLVVVVGIIVSIILVGWIMDNTVEFVSQKLEIFYNPDS
ncbi:MULTISPECIES: hypothetical protein [Nosocomiicoccus]|uniref:Uncharacterized protein n=1 Tax=Nosocomiicoccus massiliensis TaxID=1232430 RepID=A0AAF1BN79_9STAP|nr:MULTISPECIES: hypothetical protein [Nosocomiicoccus]MDK6864035.1 hypothetical protein [Nosocomiicoccus ampullae]OFL48779.1 hypothetical protein HMPREF2767_07165 [Nosocomiicoccus sp. HMSC067E10]OFO55901.1 hypothetical protein HMPREF3029_00445 [Nosocomiicoccus sp. HMSC059G07]WOS95945.1 hypothetical protein CJ229_007610 [Nosocomiicoccus massiliensis]